VRNSNCPRIETARHDDEDTLTESLAFTYDDAGFMLTASSNVGSYAFDYDAEGRLITVAAPFGVTQTFEYDARGNRILAQDSLGGTTTSDFDEYDRLTSRVFTQSGQPTLRTDFEYDWAGRVAKQINYAGSQLVSTSEYTYDAKGRLVDLVHRNSASNPLAVYDFTYDEAGQLTQQIDHSVTTNYVYDAQGQLIDDATNEYDYDAAGNRLNFDESDVVNNQPSNDEVWNYTYDAEGNLAKRSAGPAEDTWVYGYDNANHLVSATLWTEDPSYPGTAVLQREAEYQYDAFGNRLAKTVDMDGAGEVEADEQRYVLDGWNPAKTGGIGNENYDVLADLDGDSSLTTRYVRGDQVDQLLGRIDVGESSSSAYWYLADHLGSLRDVIDETGEVKASIAYDGFGNITSETGVDFAGRYKWTAREYDVETALQYNRARYYDAATGRWISQDPLGFDAGDSNLYRYVKNRPTTSADPSGMWELGSHSSYLAYQKWVRDLNASAKKEGQKGPDEQPKSEAEYDRARKDYVDQQKAEKGKSKVNEPQRTKYFPKEPDPTDSFFKTEYDRKNGDTMDVIPFTWKDIKSQSKQFDQQLGESKNWDETISQLQKSSGPSRARQRLSPPGTEFVKQTETKDGRTVWGTSPALRPGDKGYDRVHESLKRIKNAFEDVIGETIDKSMDFLASPYFQQSLRFAGGIAEFASGISMVVFSPEPTSKIAGAVLIFHGFDTMFAAFRSLESGKNQDTMTHLFGATAAKLAGADEKTQQYFGMAFDMGVPMLAQAAPSILQMARTMQSLPRLSRDGAKLVQAAEQRIAQSGTAIPQPATQRSPTIPRQTGNPTGPWELSLVDAVGSNSCFVAGTRLLTPDGDKAIEQFRTGDEILARAENSPEGAVEVKIVEQTYIRVSPIMMLRVRGQEIRTTAEHPFYVSGKGWVVASEIRIGDQLSSHDCQWVTVEGVTNLNEVTTVYNLRVSDYHTYFVGSLEWGFSVWAHNAECAILFREGEKWVLQSRTTGRILAEGTEADMLAFARTHSHDFTIPRAGDPLSLEHRALRWQEYLDSFNPGGSRAGGAPLSQTQWNARYNLNMGRMSRSQAGVNSYRSTHALWAESGEVYLTSAELPPGVSARHFDIANRDLKRAIEFKEFQGGGRPVASINNDIRREIAADQLLRNTRGWDIKWVFKGYDSLSSGLTTLLEEARIPYELIR